ncbi:MAG: YqaJ viral recombinase family protein [Treponema sp.]|jgi:hypothetical protein|nr:YqaJ viral recombinase family protein [Treponema sp.]
MGSTPKGISASRGAAVLGLSEFQTPLEVFQRIMEEREPGWNTAHGYALPPEPDSAAIRWGSAFEGAVIELAERVTENEIGSRESFFSCYGLDVTGKPLYSSGIYNYITCHIDGRYYVGGDSLHEGKTTSSSIFYKKWGTPGTDHIPRTYQVQVQHQMLCTGASEAIVSVLVFPETPEAWEKMGWKARNTPTGDWMIEKIIDDKCLDFTHPANWAKVFYQIGCFHQYPVKANPEAQRMMAEAYREFWEKHILTGIPPEPHNYDDIKRLFTEPVGTIVCDTAMTAWWREYDAIRKEIGESGNAAKRMKKLKLRILNETRKTNPVMDDESQEKVIYRDSSGNKLGQYSKKGGFR